MKGLRLATRRDGVVDDTAALRRRVTAVPREGRLSAADWVQAGQVLLREQGIAAIKLSTLTQRLRVSSGSFYHHFADFEAYLGTLADSYTADLVRKDLEDAVRGGTPGPIERLQRLARSSVQAGTFELDRAMRIWASMDPRAGAAVARGEALVLDFVAQAFSDLGFDNDEAGLRARLLLSANLSPQTLTANGSRGEFLRGCLRLLTQDAPGQREAD